MPQGRVSVSIVNYNTRGLLEDCLSAVMAQSYKDIEVVLVDNASTDGSADFVRERFPNVKVIENDRNYIFCRGQNIGINSTDGEYVLALNTDVVMDREFIAEAVKAMETDFRIGSVTGKILRPGGEVVDTTGLFLGRDRKPIERGYGKPDQGQYNEPGYVFGVCGAAALYRRAMLRQAALDGEYFDETYGAFYEDLDLAWRARRRGWIGYYTPAALAFHARGGTARVEEPSLDIFKGYAFAGLSDEMKGRLMVNRWLTILKNDRPLDFLLNLPYILLYDIKVWAYAILFSPGAISYFFKGLKAVPTAWRRRKIIHEF